MNSPNVWLFAVLALLLVAVFGASLYWAGRRGAPRWQSLTLALAAPLLVVGLYAARGTPGALNPPPPAAAPDPNAMVQGLAQRLKEHPEDLDGWIMLARSYTVLDRYAEAADAYEHAQARVVQDSGLLTNWIELRLILNGRRFDDRSRELLQQAVALAPDDPDVMLLRTLDALSHGDQATADALVSKLHEHYPPGTPDRQNLDTVLEQWKSPAAMPPPAAAMPGNGAPPDPSVMVQRLAERLKEHPEDLDGWIMLARSYTVLGRPADAAAAYEHAQAKVTQDGGLLANWIELRLRLADRKFDARTHELVDRAVALAPDNPRVAVLRALAEADRGGKTDIDALVRSLRERYPPDTPDRQRLEATLAAVLPPGK